MYTPLIVVFISIVLLLLTVFYLLGMLRSEKNRVLNRRLEEISEYGSVRSMDTPHILKSDQLSQVPFLDRRLRKMQFAYQLQKLLDSANVPMKAGYFILLMLTLAFAGFVLTIRSGNFFLMILCALFLGVLPLLSILHLRKKRIKAFEHQFPDALDMMRNAIRAGYALNRALQLVGTEAPDPAGMEFRKASEEINLGMPFNDALYNLSSRINSLDLDLFVTAILIQRESGGNLNELLQKLSHTIRERFRIAGQIRTLTAQGRMTQLILGLLPVAAMGFMFIINRDFIMVLFRTKLGNILLGIAIVMQVIGNLMIRKILKIKLR